MLQLTLLSSSLPYYKLLIPPWDKKELWPQVRETQPMLEPFSLFQVPQPTTELSQKIFVI